MRGLLISTLILGALAGCNRPDESLAFDGQFFRMSSKHVERSDRRDFTVEVSPVSASLAGAKEAGGFEGIRYCIENYGTSSIDWAIGPDTEDTALVTDRDTLLFEGTCRP